MTCNFGRDTFESWGKRKKREVTLPANVIDTGEDVDAQMRLSHEIVVLDFGDEQTSPFDFEKTTSGNSKYLSFKIVREKRFMYYFMNVRER